MIGYANLRLVPAATMGAALLISSAAFAQNDNTNQLTKHLRAVEALASYGENLKDFILTELKPKATWHRWKMFSMAIPAL